MQIGNCSIPTESSIGAAALDYVQVGLLFLLLLPPRQRHRQCYSTSTKRHITLAFLFTMLTAIGEYSLDPTTQDYKIPVLTLCLHLVARLLL